MVLTPLELLEKLAALVPRPKTHLVRYHGILAPAAKWRPSIVPPAADRESDSHPGCGSPSSPTGNVSTLTQSPQPAPRPARAAPRLRYHTWSELMQGIFKIDVLEYPRCHGRLRILAAIHPPDATRNILDWATSRHYGKWRYVERDRFVHTSPFEPDCPQPTFFNRDFGRRFMSRDAS